MTSFPETWSVVLINLDPKSQYGQVQHNHRGLGGWSSVESHVLGELWWCLHLCGTQWCLSLTPAAWYLLQMSGSCPAATHSLTVMPGKPVFSLPWVPLSSSASDDTVQTIGSHILRWIHQETVSTQSWRERLVSKLLAARAWGPGFGSPALLWKSWVKGIFQESTRTTPAKTPSISGEGSRTGLL